MSFVELEEIDGVLAAKCPDSFIKEGLEKWRNTLMGHFIGGRPSFTFARDMLLKQWRISGHVDVNLLDSGFFIFRFNLDEDKIKVLEGGPWYVQRRPMILRPWSPNPIVTDKMTRSMARLSYARLCVEVSADKELPLSIPVCGDDGFIFNQKVVYVWKPPRCKHCKVFGHLLDTCKFGSNGQTHKDSRPKKEWRVKGAVENVEGVLAGGGAVLQVVSDGVASKQPEVVAGFGDAILNADSLITGKGKGKDLDLVGRESRFGKKVFKIPALNSGGQSKAKGLVHSNAFALLEDLTEEGTDLEEDDVGPQPLAMIPNVDGEDCGEHLVSKDSAIFKNLNAKSDLVESDPSAFSMEGKISVFLLFVVLQGNYPLSLLNIWCFHCFLNSILQFMAERTRSTKIDEAIKNLQSFQAALLHDSTEFKKSTEANFADLHSASKQFMSHVDARLDSLQFNNGGSTYDGESRHEGMVIPRTPNQFAMSRSMRLDAPRFDGTDVAGWVFKAAQFFEYHQTPPDQRFLISSFHMEGPALSWFRWMHCNKLIVSWPQFLQALKLRFGPSIYEDPKGQLAKLQHVTTVATYQAPFEELSTRIHGLSEDFLISFFISGLKPEPRKELLVAQLCSLVQAMALAQLQEDKFNDLKQSWKQPWNKFSNIGINSVPQVHGVEPDKDKIEAMLLWPVPKDLKSLRGFLGLTGYYRRFVRNYASLAVPLTDLLKKDCFHWNDGVAAAFVNLKAAMTNLPVLALPDFNVPFELETDASGLGIGAVLIQLGHPIAFFSKKLSCQMRAASTYVRELFAITQAVKKWRQYRIGRSFVIRTDHKSLKHLMEQVIQTPEQQCYLTKLLGFTYTISYKPGKENKVADALSRIPEVMGSGSQMSYACSMVQTELLAAIRKENVEDSKWQTLHQAIQNGTLSDLNYTIRDGLLFFKGKLRISSHSPLRQELFQLYHNSLVMGVKYATSKPAGLLQPLPIPDQIWEDISMDFVTSLPLSRGYSVILVVVDRLTKAVHFGPLPSKFNASSVAQLFVDMVVKHHGFPKSIVSDRDETIVSTQWYFMEFQYFLSPSNRWAD
ncbi:uncharacterized protein LOC122648058 [Telopea speciosissima]|uniref:uncharacterized protein LOC122648058 n=1 Tax=Telopea speciosissima TaxID=54955 RepID=UPI001CC3D878|nr:uncharacterized protein LOC122648058 [Telopea speciosissima]